MRLRLALRVRRGAGWHPGEHRVAGRTEASGIELAGHRDYVPGDDLRHLDWNVLGRLDRLVVRRFAAERAATVHLLVDASASMAVPARDGKLAAACALADALAAIALGGGDTVRPVLLGGPDGVRLGPVLRHRGALPRLRVTLDAARAAGRLAFGGALAAYARAHPRPGVALVVSDFTGDPAELEPGVLAFRARGYDVALLHVIGAGELDPSREFTSGLLRDVETGETHPVRLTAAVRARHAELLDEHLAALAALALRAGAAYARLVAGTPVETLVTGELVRQGVVRRR
jgi:uncharacterized protein (DUF58 family)